MAGDQARSAHPALTKWARTTRLNPVSGLAAFRDDPAVAATRERIKRFAFPAAVNLQAILSAPTPAARPS